MPTLSTVRPSRRWGTQTCGYPDLGTRHSGRVDYLNGRFGLYSAWRDRKPEGIRWECGIAFVTGEYGCYNRPHTTIIAIRDIAQNKPRRGVDAHCAYNATCCILPLGTYHITSVIPVCKHNVIMSYDQSRNRVILYLLQRAQS